MRAGERVAVRIPAVRVLKKSGWSAPSALRVRVSGTIRDAAGRPLAGYRAFLHAKAAMLGKPEFVSEPSGPDGAYLIWVDREGVFYLGARAEIGRSREERETIGLYRGAADHGIDGAPRRGGLRGPGHRRRGRAQAVTRLMLRNPLAPPLPEGEDGSRVTVRLGGGDVTGRDIVVGGPGP